MWVERTDQAIDILFQLVLLEQLFQEPADWHVGDGVEAIKNNAMIFRQFPFVGRLQPCLFWGKLGADGVINQVQVQTASFLAVPVPVQCSEGFNRPFKNPFTALAVRVFR